jgi:hypothetical protein
MTKVKITLSDVNKKYLKIVAYLVVSGVLGYVLAAYIAKDPNLTGIFAPAINFVIYIIKNELGKEGYTEVIKENK